MMGPPRVIKVLMGARGAALRAGPFTVCFRRRPMMDGFTFHFHRTIEGTRS